MSSMAASRWPLASCLSARVPAVSVMPRRLSSCRPKRCSALIGIGIFRLFQHLFQEKGTDLLIFASLRVAFLLLRLA